MFTSSRFCGQYMPDMGLVLFIAVSALRIVREKTHSKLSRGHQICLSKRPRACKIPAIISQNYTVTNYPNCHHLRKTNT